MESPESAQSLARYNREGGGGYCLGEESRASPDRMVSRLNEERTYAYTASWQLLEERVDADYSGDPGLDKRVQYVWGLRYIDDCLMHRADVNNDGDYTDSYEDTWYHMTDGMFSTVAVLASVTRWTTAPAQ